MIKDKPLYLYSEAKYTIIRVNEIDIYLCGYPVFMNDCSTNAIIRWKQVLIDTINICPDKINTSLQEIIERTTGLFLIIIKTEKEIIIASDLIRSFPLFYGYYDGQLYVTDNTEKLRDEVIKLEFDFRCLEQFIIAGLVFGNGTIFKDFYGIQAGEIVTLRSGSWSSTPYYRFSSMDKPTQGHSVSDYANQLDELLGFVFNRAVVLNPEVGNWVIPLSGGHDSRLIVNYLYRLGVRNVICFSYGSPNNIQSQISQLVADSLGYDWYFVEYTEDKWQNMHNLGILDKYIIYSFNGVSTPHLQDLLAVHELKKNGVIREGDIILPGHTSVTVDEYGSHTAKLKTKEAAIEYAYNKSLRIKSPVQITSIYNYLDNTFDLQDIKAGDFYAFIDWKERQSKFISNSNKTYAYFGFESRLPMWEREMMEFWLQLPLEMREGRSLLYFAEKNGVIVEELLGIPYASNSRTVNSLSAKDILRFIVPDFIITPLLNITGYKTRLNESLNLIYSLKAGSVRQLLDPVEEFPESILSCLKGYMNRRTYQMDPVILTSLYAIRMQLNSQY